MHFELFQGFEFVRNGVGSGGVVGEGSSVVKPKWITWDLVLGPPHLHLIHLNALVQFR